MRSVTVAVVAIGSDRHVARCLAALAAQERAPPFDVVVVCDAAIADMAQLEKRFPHVRFVVEAGPPLELAARAVGAALGDLVLLTEDHCVPRPDWVRTMTEAKVEGRAVVGGRVETGEGASATDWAFYFVDFFRYAAPVAEGHSPSVSVCNACYARADLAAIEEIWKSIFHETAVHEALRLHFGALWLEPRSEVTMSRHVGLRDALRERYSFGRMFACTRMASVGFARRLSFALLSPLLPKILLGRMARKALRSPRLFRSFLRSLIPLTLLVLAWSWGEWLGYVTGRRPRSLAVAPELEAAPR